VAKATTFYDRNIGLPGLVAPGFYPHSVESKLLVANTAYLARFVPSAEITIDSISFICTVADAANPQVDLGLYEGGTRLMSTGATVGELLVANSVRSLLFAAQTLQAGTVYYAALSSNSSVAGVMSATWPVNLGPKLLGASAEVASAPTLSHPLPATATLGIATTFVPILGVKE